MLRCVFVIIVFISIIVAFIQADGMTKDIFGKVHVPREELQLGVRVSVDNNGEQQVTYARSDQSFVLYNLTAGTHFVDFYSTNFLFPQVRVDISGKTNRHRAFAIIPSASNTGIEGFGYTQTVISADPILHVKPITKLEYFDVEEPFDPLSLLKNPMVITLIVGLAIALLAPKLVDPEAMKEVQATMSQNETEVKNIFSSLTGKKEDNQPKAVESGGSQQSKKKK